MPYGYGFIYMIGAQVLFFIFTTVLIVWIIKNSKQKDVNTPKDVLDKRLASGEIDKKQYNSILKTILDLEAKIKWKK